ncbi:MAG: hypothetical protein SH857_12155 [Chitinophagales bacterium]|nr:hypothetical protein [Chitinophagales bacterium]
MKNFACLFFIASLLWSCSQGTQNAETTATAADSTSAQPDSTAVPVEETKSTAGIETLQMGMKADTVITLLGEPTKIDTLKSDPKISVQEWWYGDNQKVRLIQGQVNRVIRDVAGEQALLKELVDAKKKGDEAEVKRLMEKLTKNDLK